MVSIDGLYKFRDFFEAHKDKYVLIGGTACSVVFDEIGEDFRATKDLDIVLIIENIGDDFGEAFWSFIKAADYERIETGNGKKCFYRFKNPRNPGFPKMIELFSRNPGITLFPDSHLTPIHISDDISSLSAILLNEDYYNFLLNGRRVIDGLSILDEKYLIPFKVKAWCELTQRRDKGESGNLRHIKKHYKDIMKLLMLLPESERISLPPALRADIQLFISSAGNKEYISQDVDNDFLCQRLSEIYLA